MIGSRVTAEAAGRGLDITGITRSGSDVPGAARTIKGDMADAEKVLHVEENTGALFHLGHGVFSHSVSKRAFSSATLVR